MILWRWLDAVIKAMTHQAVVAPSQVMRNSRCRPASRCARRGRGDRCPRLDSGRHRRACRRRRLVAALARVIRPPGMIFRRRLDTAIGVVTHQAIVAPGQFVRNGRCCLTSGCTWRRRGDPRPRLGGWRGCCARRRCRSDNRSGPNCRRHYWACRLYRLTRLASSRRIQPRKLPIGAVAGTVTAKTAVVAATGVFGRMTIGARRIKTSTVLR